MINSRKNIYRIYYSSDSIGLNDYILYIIRHIVSRMYCYCK